MMMSRLHTLLTASLLPLLACGKTDERPVDTIAVTQPASTNASTTATRPAGTTASTPGSELVVTERGIGGLRVGMTFAEARAVFPGLRVPKGAETISCDYASRNGLPPGIGLMVGEGTIKRVDVNRDEFATAAGARIGDSEERIKSLYPGRVTVTPHEYTDGHYLTVAPSSGADSAYRIVFETDGSRVLSYRAGILPHVGYVEGCS